MRDSEQEYPPHQPRRGSRRRPPDDVDNKDDQDALGAGRSTGSRAKAAAAPASLLPRDRWRDTLLIGVIAGFLCIAQNIIITLVNTPSYHAYDAATSSAVKTSLSFTLFVIGLLVFGIALLICFIAGFIAGKMVVRRGLGFLAGFIAGVLFDGSVIVTHYIPGYPGNQQGGTPASNAGNLLGSIAFAAVVLIAAGVITGLFSLLGSWIATRRHPYYVEG
ncbi:MAG: hypothetical protein WCD86_26755 [Ktedonobacteraceae bacterium]